VLKKAPGLELVLEVGGQFDYGLVITARSAFDVESFFDSLTRTNKTALSGVSIQARTGWYYFGVKYLGGASSARTTAIVPPETTITLVPKDIEVLQVFSQSRDGNRQTMARVLGMPLSTLQYRIEHLVSSGVVAGVLYQIVADKIGYEAYRALISTRLPSHAHRTAILEWAQKHPAVLTFMHGFGNWEYELRIEARDTRTARATVDELHDRFSDFIRTTEIIPVSQVLRMELTPHPSILRSSVRLIK
jgi:DNA-binding Lrp family transcriptional regulator